MRGYLREGRMATVHDVRKPITCSTDGPAVLLKILTIAAIMGGLGSMRNRKSSGMRSVGELVPRANHGGTGQLPGEKPGSDAHGEIPSDPGAPNIVVMLVYLDEAYERRVRIVKGFASPDIAHRATIRMCALDHAWHCLLNGEGGTRSSGTVSRSTL